VDLLPGEREAFRNGITIGGIDAKWEPTGDTVLKVGGPLTDLTPGKHSILAVMPATIGAVQIPLSKADRIVLSSNSIEIEILKRSDRMGDTSTQK